MNPRSSLMWWCTQGWPRGANGAALAWRNRGYDVILESAREILTYRSTRGAAALQDAATKFTPPPQKILNIILSQKKTRGTAVPCEATVAQGRLNLEYPGWVWEVSYLGLTFPHDRRTYSFIVLSSPISHHITVPISKEGGVYSVKVSWPVRSGLLCEGCWPREHTSMFQIPREMGELLSRVCQNFLPHPLGMKERGKSRQVLHGPLRLSLAMFANEPILLTFLFITNHVKIPSNLWIHVPVYIVSLPFSHLSSLLSASPPS